LWVITIKPDPTSVIAHAEPGDTLDIYVHQEDGQIVDTLLRDIRVYGTKDGVITLWVDREARQVLQSYRDRQHRLFLRPSNGALRRVEHKCLESGFRWDMSIKFDPTSPVAHTKPGDRVDIYVRRRDNQESELAVSKPVLTGSLRSELRYRRCASWTRRREGDRLAECQRSRASNIRGGVDCLEPVERLPCHAACFPVAADSWWR
jgi:hypothetical protein